MDMGLKSRVAIVAASSQGIGRATAEAFAAEGCRVAMCARNAPALAEAAGKIKEQYSVEVFHQAMDVTEAHAVHEFVEAVVAKFGAADICVTNAGGPPAKGFLAASGEDWRKAIDANFMSAVYFAREVIPHMQRRRWGRIVTITSITTKQPVADLVLSNAVRAAVVGLVKSLAKSRSAASGKAEREIFEGWAADAPLCRLGEPSEVADAIVWLASDRASYVTGQTVLVDGGMYKGL